MRKLIHQKSSLNVWKEANGTMHTGPKRCVRQSLEYTTRWRGLSGKASHKTNGLWIERSYKGKSKWNLYRDQSGHAVHRHMNTLSTNCQVALRVLGQVGTSCETLDGHHRWLCAQDWSVWRGQPMGTDRTIWQTCGMAFGLVLRCKVSVIGTLLQ